MYRIITLIIIVLLVGCAGTERKTGSEKIMVVLSRSDVPKGKLLGDCMGYCGNWWNSIFLSNEYMYDNSMNMLRNKALDMGGDYVFIQQIQPNGTSLIFIGNVYSIDR